MKKSKLLLLAFCAALIVVATVFSTLAYLTDSSKVVNKFTVGKVDLKLDETAVDANGKATSGRTEEGNKYHLVPGMTYVKDPTVTVIAGSEESYVRLLVTVNCYDALTDIFGDPFLPQYFVSGWDSATWISTQVIDVDDTADTATYEFRYKSKVKPEGTDDLVLDALFDSITVPANLTGAQLEKIAKLEINIEAHAIQAAGFDDADHAWVAFTK